ncbi:MAG TPA: hypothetical protein VK763_17200 [Terriglobales bacterium]|jgi:hypothetical protein|nr:hypothetical protein [Terriglobales bacterium]
MAKQNQPERWESVIVAAAMAVAGTLFMFDRLGSLVRSGMLSWQTTLHTAPMLLVVLGVGLLLAEQERMTPSPVRSGNRRSKEGQS